MHSDSTIRVRTRTGLPLRLVALALCVLLALPTVADAQGYRIGAGDKLSVEVAGSPEFGADTQVREDGTVGLPYLGAVKIAGMTAAQAEKHLERALVREKLLKHPQVTVTITDYVSRQVTVMGKVNKPGNYGLSGPTTVLDLLARCGGTVKEAADHVILVRTVDGQRKRYRMGLESLASGKAAGTKVKAGDVIVVPKMSVFYIEGAVNKPGQYRYEEGMTVMQALAIGGGVTPRGDYDRIVVKREDKDGKMHTYDAEEDDRLRPGDLVHVKERIF
ncbi:MAG: SLBB domain-containing protein [Ectothiorhodospiraceae bacterium]|jgi:polysaccharide export outer membrane protein